MIFNFHIWIAADQLSKNEQSVKTEILHQWWMDPNSKAGTPVYNWLKTVNSRCFIVRLLLAEPMGLVFTHVYKNDDVPNIFCKIFCQQQILTTQSLLYLVSMSASQLGGQRTVKIFTPIVCESHYCNLHSFTTEEMVCNIINLCTAL